MRHTTEPSLLCADHGTPLRSRLAEHNGCKVELVHPCPTCRDARRDRRYVIPKGDGNGKFRPQELVPVADPPVMRTLICEACGNQWERPAQRGRLPRTCEACRG